MEEINDHDIKLASQTGTVPADSFKQSTDPNVQPNPVNVTIGGIPQHWGSTAPISRRDIRKNNTPLATGSEFPKILRFKEFTEELDHTAVNK